MISAALRLLSGILSLKADVNVSTIRNKRKTQLVKDSLFVGILKASTKKSRIRIRIGIRNPVVLDPHPSPY